MAYKTTSEIDYSKIKSSTLQFVEQGDTWSNKNNQTFFKYILHLKNGEKPQFLAKNQSTIERFKEGLEQNPRPVISYYYKQEGQTFAALAPKDYVPPIQENNMANNSNPAPNFQTQKQPPMTQQESIARSVAWNNVSQFIFTEEFKNHGLEPYTKDKDGNTIILSQQQLYMLDQASHCADIIYKKLITKPK